jgi:signal transduction histidine kinase
LGVFSVRQRARSGTSTGAVFAIADSAFLDAALAVALLLFAVASFRVPGRDVNGTDVILLATVSGSIVFRQQAPEALLVAYCGLRIVQMWIDRPEAYVTWAISIALFAVAAARRPPVALVAWAATTGVFVCSVGGVPLNPALIGSSVAFFGAPLAAGLAVRRERQLSMNLAIALDEISALTDERERSAAAGERSRIRDDLHDVVGHHIHIASVLASNAAAAHGTDEAHVALAIGGIQTACRAALDEMDRTTAKSTCISTVDVEPTLLNYPELLSTARSVGLEIVDVWNIPRAKIDQLAPVVSRCAQRFLREAFTNVIKHAETQRCRVEVLECQDSLVITVTSPERVDRPLSVRRSGILRIDQRVRVLGGELRAFHEGDQFVQQANFPNSFER